MVSAALLLSHVATLSGTAIWQRFNIASASADVVGSATVGPDAITVASSPGTSDMA